MIKSNRKDTVKDLTVGTPWKVLIAFAIPVFISQLFQQLYNTADALIVGKFLGDEAFTAVSASGTLVFLLVGFFEGTAMGAGVVISKYFGSGENDKVSRAIHTNLVLGLFSGILLTLVGVTCTKYFLKWTKIDVQVLPQAIDYFKVYFSGAISLIMYNICRGIMTALGDGKRPLLYLIVSSVTNIILDTLFVGLLGLGVWSAALATVIAQTLSVVLCLIHLTKKDRVYTVSFKKLRISTDLVGEILRYGLPSGVQNSVIGFANIIVQTQINSFGMYSTAGHGAYSRIEGFAFLPITSFTMALAPFVSQNLGAKKYDRVRKGAQFGIITCIILAETIGMLTYIFAPTLIRIFVDEENSVAFGVENAKICSIFFFLLALSHSISAVLRGSGRAIVPMSVMLLCWCIIRVIYIMLVMKFIGEVRFVHWAYPITWTLSSAIYILFYYFSSWDKGFKKQK